ncbi:MAG: AraC family ligand binding domain-containing protein [Aliarcobacter sp.]
MKNAKFSNDDFTKHYHGTYTIGLTYAGVLKSYNIKQTFESYEYSVRVNNPREVHAGQSKQWSHANFLSNCRFNSWNFMKTFF